MLLNSKINLLSGLATVLVLGFSSCTEVPVDTDQIVHRKVVDEYKSNFIAKYGQPALDQSWDFTKHTPVDSDVLVEDPFFFSNSLTRAESSATTELSEYEEPVEPNGDIKIWNLNSVKTVNELAYINAYAPSLPTLNWSNEYIYGVHDMWVWYARGFAGQYEVDEEGNYIYPDGVANYSLGIHARTLNGGSQNAGTEYFTSLPIMGMASSTGYSYGSGNTDANTQGSGNRIDASGLNDEMYVDVYWYAMVDDGTNVTNSEGGQEFRAKWELKTFKEYVTPYGAIYWLFDCNHDGDYRDLICLVEPARVKRYIVEDLGALDDFDFNDIVVDVVSNKDGQYAIVRAMGGTLDFELTIGNTKWSKSGNNFDAATVYNAYDGEINYAATLSTFNVEEWDPDENNISVTVKERLGDGVIISFPFPKAGEVPMIIAITPTTYFTDPNDASSRRYWMPERVSIPARLFTTE